MKYLFLSYLFVCLFSLDVHSQKWDNIYGTSNHTETQRDLVESYDNGYLISGSYKIPSSSNWLIKTDINGDVLWDKVILHDLHEVFSGNLDQNSSGEIAIGRCISQDNGDQWPTVVKLDSCGNKLWCREFIDDEYTHGWFEDVILFDNGDVLALGYMFTFESYNERIFLYYIDKNGTLVWRQSYASKENHPLVLERMGGGLHQFENEFIITGRCYYPYLGNPTIGYIRPFFIGVDNEFNEKWILPFGVNDSLLGEANSVIPLNDSVYMGVGYMWASGSKPNSLYMFFNNEGEELGYTQITNEDIGPDIQANIPTSIARMNDSLFIASTYFGTEQYENPFGELIIDTSGIIYKSESRPNTTGISTLIKTFDNKYVIGCTYRHSNSNRDIYLYKINDSLQHDTVYTGNYVYDSLCPYQIQSGVIDITDCLLVTDVGETPTPKEYFASLKTITIKAYPNPVKENQITFSYTNTEHHQNMELRCFNVFGELVHQERVYQHQGESKVNIQSWQAGIYVVLNYSNGQIVGQSKFIVK
ncbi:MAG: T9SS type A sorting domain-containing protein [Bacteroidales bacterium]|nr:T9SS type A sorting domain-containing protein [Bacteroidales bacterium]